MKLLLTLEGRCYVVFDLRNSCDWCTKKHQSVTVKSSCEWFSVSFAVGQLLLLWEIFSPLGHLFAVIQRLACAGCIAAIHIPSAAEVMRLAGEAISKVCCSFPEAEGLEEVKRERFFGGRNWEMMLSVSVNSVTSP